MSNVSTRIDAAIKIGLDDCLTYDGYKKKNRTFYLDNDELIKVVNIQLSKLNYAGFGRFTINLGIYFPSVALLITDKVTHYPKQYECIVFTRIGHLLPQNIDFWWDINENSDIDLIADDLKKAWMNYGKPWIDKYNNLVDAKEFCLKNNNLIGIIAICLTLGQIEEANDRMKKALESELNPETRERYQTYANKFGLID